MTAGKDNKKGAPQSFSADIHNSFLANVNHALRTPLNGMLGMTQLLAKTGLDESQLEYLDVLRETSGVLMMQLENIFDINKAENDGLHAEPVSARLDDIVKTALQPLVPLSVKRKIPLSVDYPANAGQPLSVDKEKLTKILTNLLYVSLKFAESGKILLKVIAETPEARPDIKKVRFVIENNRVLYGTLVHAIEHYKDFNSEDLRDFGDVTLSLAAVEKLLETMGSSIEYESLAGHEPPFHFIFEAGVPADAPRPSAYDRLKNKRALIFQDDIKMDLILQALQLWEIDYHIVRQDDNLVPEVEAAVKEGRPYHIFIGRGKDHHSLEEKHRALFEKFILIDAPHNKDQDANITCMKAPVYPDELMAAFADVYIKQAPLPGQDKTARILIVEDDFVSRLYVSELLQGLGYITDEAENGYQAVQKMQEETHPYDLVLMDCMMPRLDGYQATSELREAGHEMPIIALTANTLEQDREKCLKAGMNDYLSKPVKETALQMILQKHLT